MNEGTGQDLRMGMRGKIFISVIALAALAPSARAAERVTLRNGFTIRCDHSAPVQGRVRLYLSSGGDNYIELAPGDIAAVEPVPDPVPDPTSAQLVPRPPRPAATAVPELLYPESTPPSGIFLKKMPHFTNLKMAHELWNRSSLNPGDLAEILAAAGRDHDLDVDLLASVVKAESSGNPRAVSPAGARGLMQLMPRTAASLGVENSFQPQQNVQGGSAYLDALLTRYRNNLALALAAYNAGPQAVDRYNGIPPYAETRAYVARVIHEFNRRVLAREALARRARASRP